MTKDSRDCDVGNNAIKVAGNYNSEWKLSVLDCLESGTEPAGYA